MQFKILLILLTLFGHLSANSIKVKGGLIYKDEGTAQINQEHSIFKRTVDTSALQSVEQRLKDGTKLYEEFNSERTKLMTELKNDKECEKEKILTSKIICLDNLMRNILKFRNDCYEDKKSFILKIIN